MAYCPDNAYVPVLALNNDDLYRIHSGIFQKGAVQHLEKE